MPSVRMMLIEVLSGRGAGRRRRRGGKEKREKRERGTRRK